jgi:hypothetical protein
MRWGDNDLVKMAFSEVEFLNYDGQYRPYEALSICTYFSPILGLQIYLKSQIVHIWGDNSRIMKLALLQVQGPIRLTACTP